MNMIYREFGLSGIIIVGRESMTPQPSKNISEGDRKNFIRHFENRDKAEEKYFGFQKVPHCQELEVDVNGLNSDRCVEFIDSIQPEIVLIFGSGLVKEPLLASLPQNTINLHLGISPRYRGAATLFWPFYFMEPCYAGSTFHYIVSEPDAGDIIHQTVPALSPEDGIHDVACKVVVASAKDSIKLLKIYEEGRQWETYRQKGTGKNFLISDFKAEHLRVIYNVFNDDIVRHYLEGNLEAKKPRLISQF